MIFIKKYSYRGYMRLISVLCIFLLTTFFIGCDKNDEFQKKYEILSSKNGNKLMVRTDTCIFLSGVDSIIPDKPSKYTETEILNRFIDSYTEDQYWIKTKLGDWCVKYGLSTDSLYISKRYIYSQYIPEKKGYVAIPFISTPYQMGLIYNISKNIIGFNGGYGVTPIKGIYGNCWTVIFNIKYDSQGNEVNVYYPCNPEQLKWYYYWYKI